MQDARTEIELLQEFVAENSEAAFAELVRRHIDLVYSVALRQLRGDAHLASDATQAVFCELARNARKLTAHRTLSGWLYTTTRFVASRMARSQMRRTAREQAFVMKQSEQSGNEAGWKDVENLLDDAMQELSSEDREAVLLRFFKNESFGGIGAVFGASENAARMRVERALEKLRVALNRRGVTCPSAVLSGLLAANAISTAPAGLAGTLAGPALASASAGWALPGAVKVLELMAATKMKTAVAVIALAGTTTGWIVAHRNSVQLEAEMARVRQKAWAQLPANPPEGMIPEDPARLRAERNELMRLRGEVTDLRRQLRERPAAAPTGPTAITEAAMVAMTPEEQGKEELKTRGIARLNIAKIWGIAFQKFALANNGQMPAGFQQAQDSSPEISEPLLKFATEAGMGGANGDGFEMTFQGRLDEIENPAQAIIMREKEPFHYGEDGSASRTYLFADGHSEIHKARNGNFERWEEERQPRLKPASGAAE
jgi:RNA polymerase sigma factor (sigma-70 family)